MYVLGALTTEEAAEVEQMAEVHPAVQAAIAQATQLLSRYAAHFQEVPPSTVRKGVLRRMDALDTPGKRVSGEVDATSKAEATIRYARVALAASLGFIIVAMLTAINFYLRWQDAATLAARLHAEKTEQTTAKATLIFPDGELFLASIVQSDYELVPLCKIGGGEQSIAWLSWDSNKQEAFLWLGQLPAPDEGTTYQLWASQNGDPVPLGPMPWGADVQRVAAQADYEQFFIVLEPAGGATQHKPSSVRWVGKR